MMTKRLKQRQGASSGRRDAPPRSCLVVAMARLGLATDTPLDTDLLIERAEIELEAAAADLEGGCDQELVVSGVGECGDLVVDVVELDAHGSLAEYRAWLKTGAPRPEPRRSLVLNLEIEGSELAILDAASRLVRVFAGVAAIEGVTMTWRETGLPAQAWDIVPQPRLFGLDAG